MVESANRRRGVVGAAALVALVLMGCASVDEPVATAGRSPVVDPSTKPADVDEVASSPAPAVPRLSELVPGTVIATGEFDGGAAGRIEIRANGTDRGFDVSLAGLTPVPSAGASLELSALEATAGEHELRSGFSYYRYDPLQPSTDQTFTTPGVGYGGFETNDPSYMRTAIIWAAEPGTSFMFGSIVARAPLTWLLPDMNPGIDVVDHGAADGARGRVTLAADGSPESYRVAWGDTPDGITGRFGITMDDLEWLNPDRLSTRLILADITLNLDRDSRGLRE